MSKLEQHPTVRAYRERPSKPVPPSLSHQTLRNLCLEAGADDVGFVALDRTELDEDRPGILKTFAAARTAIAIVVKMNTEPVRSPSRSVANLVLCPKRICPLTPSSHQFLLRLFSVKYA